MGAWKQFLASDVIITPFEVNKGFSFNTASFTDSDVQIDRFRGLNVSGTFYPDTALTTGTNSTQYQVLVYNSIKELYYSNFLSASTGDNVATGSIVPGEDEAGNVIIGAINSPLYYNYLSSTLTPLRYFPTQSSAKIGVISIPVGVFGDYLQPNSVIISSGSFSLYDDGEGNMLISGSNLHYGNVIYEHGIIILTNTGSYATGNGGGPVVTPPSVYALAEYLQFFGSMFVYGGVGSLLLPDIDSFITGSGVNVAFSSSYTIYETQYKATINENEFNFSQNPSLISGSVDGTIYDFVTKPYFQPYVTTVGLYNEAQELLAVGKLSQPLPLSRTTDTSIFINIDR